MKGLSFSYLALLVLVTAGCSSIQSRIDDNEDYFNNLSIETRELIHQGKVIPGFEEKAVFLAMGLPNDEFLLSDGTFSYPLWVYTKYTGFAPDMNYFEQHGEMAAWDIYKLQRLPLNEAFPWHDEKEQQKKLLSPFKFEVADCYILLEHVDNKLVVKRKFLERDYILVNVEGIKDDFFVMMLQRILKKRVLSLLRGAR